MLQNAKQYKQLIRNRSTFLLREAMKLPNPGTKNQKIVAPGFRHQALGDDWIRILPCAPAGLRAKGVT